MVNKTQNTNDEKEQALLKIVEALNGFSSQEAEAVLANALYAVWNQSSFQTDRVDFTFSEHLKLPNSLSRHSK